MKKKIKKKTKAAKATERQDDHEAGAAAAAESPKKGRPTTVNYADFVRTWRDAATVSEVADALGIKRNSASAIAARLRKGGVTLKSFPRRGSQPINVKQLNKIAAGKE